MTHNRTGEPVTHTVPDAEVAALARAFGVRVHAAGHIGRKGGFGGCYIVRLETEDGVRCLRRWPAETPVERVRFLQAVIRHAASRGFDLFPHPLPAADGDTFIVRDGHPWELTTWAAGAPDYALSPGPARLAAAARALARMHLALDGFTPPGPRYEASPAAMMQALEERDLSPQPPLRSPARRGKHAGTPESPRACPGVPGRALKGGGSQELATAPDPSSPPSLRKGGWGGRSAWPGDGNGDPITSGDADIQAARRLLAMLPTAYDRIRGAMMRYSAVFADTARVAHGDIDPEHLFFTGDEVTGIIDFDETGFRPQAVDVAMLLERFTGWQPDLMRAALNAYHAVRPLAGDEIAALPALATLSIATWAWEPLHLRFIEGNDFSMFREGFAARAAFYVRRLAAILDALPL